MPTADARLAGARVLVTRPASQATELQALIRSAGGEPVSFPTLAIEPVTPEPARIEAMAAADTLIFVSANAVRHGWPLVSERAGGGQRVIAVGPATGRALKQAGCTAVTAPAGNRSSSEDLLASPELADVSGRAVCIVRGRGGRETLGRQLAARGARVCYLECYERRRPPHPDTAILTRALDEGRDSLVVSATSVAGLSNLLALTPEPYRDRLRARPLVVIGARQKAAALENGWSGPILEAGAGDAHIVEVIARWREQTR